MTCLKLELDENENIIVVEFYEYVSLKGGNRGENFGDEIVIRGGEFVTPQFLKDLFERK